jgi:hypothetical protein
LALKIDFMIKQIISSALLLGFSFVLFGCATAPTTFDSEKAQGQWEAKAQVRDLEKNKSDTVTLEVMAQKNHALRMEVNGTMGVHVASLLMKDSDISYAIHTQKRFISGPVSAKSLKPLLNVNLDPRWLYSIFFDSPLEGWNCKNSEAGLIESCDRADGAKIAWADRNGEKKRITISSTQFEVQVLVKDFTTKVQSPEKAFSLDAPEGYKRYKLQ